MEAARRLDEWRVLSKKIPSTDMIPEFVVQENREGQINLNTSEWLILSKIDGHRSIKAIAAASGLSRVRRGQDPLRPDRRPASSACGSRRARARRRRRAAAARPPRPPPPAAPAAPRRPAPARDGGARRARPAASGAAGALNRVRDVCNALLGAVGESVVNKHYLKAKAELERGAGFEAIEEAINQIARAASILKGPSTTETPCSSSSRPSAELSVPRRPAAKAAARRARASLVLLALAVARLVRRMAVGSAASAPRRWPRARARGRPRALVWMRRPAVLGRGRAPETLAVPGPRPRLSPARAAPSLGLGEHGRRLRRLRGAAPARRACGRRPSSPRARTTRARSRATWRRSSRSLTRRRGPLAG